MCYYCDNALRLSGDESPAVCASYLLRESDRMGIPHFQRGQVWPDGAAGQLLESLLQDTPCGTVMLWEASDPEAQGVPVGNGSFEKLILDGQQRIRALRNMFGADKAETGWAVNLDALAARFGATNSLRDGHRARSPFLSPSDAARAKPTAQLALGVLVEPHADVESLVREQLAARADESVVAQVARALRGLVSKNLFNVRVLDAGRSISDVVGIYNRINSAGIRVEAEERAYATLVSLAPSATSRALRSSLTGGNCAGQQLGSLAAIEAVDLQTRDRELQRRRESEFGFKLFIRTAVQSCLYHANLTVGSSGFDFGKIDLPSLRDAAKLDGGRRFDFAIEEAAQAMVACRRLLVEDLHCDDLRFVPDAWTLQPALQLLITFPSLREDTNWRQTLAALVLRWSIAPPTRARHQIDAIRSIVGAPNASEAVTSAQQAMLPDVAPGLVVRSRLEDRVRTSDAQNSRMAKLLYWLLRRNGARDFSYRNLELGGITHRQEFHPVGAELDVNLQNVPTFQHIVPFTYVSRLHGDHDRRTTGSHPANRIGNVTYISWASNTLQGMGGLGDTPVNLAIEPSENAAAHLLHQKPDIRAISMASSRIEFENFCAEREDNILRQFIEWLDQSEAHLATDHLSRFETVTPAERRLQQ